MQIRYAHERGSSQFPWLESYHSFSFGEYYDPAFMGHGPLLVINDDRVAPHSGFATHGHKNMEIFTFLLSGELRNLLITLHSVAHVLPGEIGKAAIAVNDGSFTKSPTQPDRLAACARRGFAKQTSSVLQLFDVTRYACKTAP